MNTTKVIGDLTQLHIDSLAKDAAEAYLAKASVDHRQVAAQLKLKRTLAGMDRRGIWESNKKTGGGGRHIYQRKDGGDQRMTEPQSLRIKARLRAIRRESEVANMEAHDCNIAIAPIVLTDFCDVKSATKIDFGY